MIAKIRELFARGRSETELSELHTARLEARLQVADTGTTVIDTDTAQYEADTAYSRAAGGTFPTFETWLRQKAAMAG